LKQRKKVRPLSFFVSGFWRRLEVAMDDRHDFLDDRHDFLLVGNEKKKYMCITHFATNLQHTAMGGINDVCDHVGDSIHKAILSLSLFLIECGLPCFTSLSKKPRPPLPWQIHVSQFMLRNMNLLHFKHSY